jgi:DNA-binding transcriptional regulator YbjK
VSAPSEISALGVGTPRGPARRLALLEAALRIVAELGTGAVTHRRVAEEAGVPLASTTYWFESKAQLLTAAFELAAKRDVGRLDSHVAMLSRLPGSIDAVVSALVEPLDEERRNGEGSLLATYALLLEAARRPALQELAHDWTEVYLSALGHLLQRAGSTTPRADAKLLLGTTNGLLVEQIASGRPSNLSGPLRRLVSALLCGARDGQVEGGDKDPRERDTGPGRPRPCSSARFREAGPS